MLQKNGDKKLMFKRIVTDGTQTGWVNEKINNNKSKWITYNKESGTSQVDLKLQLKCVGCKIDVEKKKPMLDISEETKIRKRSRRSLKCTLNLNGGCCLDNFVVRFADFMGPHANNIIVPKSIDIRQCRGYCSHGTISKAHGAILRAAQSKSASSEDSRLCCVPQRYKPFPILISNGNEITRKIINDVAVSECGCV